MNTLIATAFACCFAMGGWFKPASPSAERHLLVTDQDGRPVPHAQVFLSGVPRAHEGGLALPQIVETDRAGRAPVCGDEGYGYHLTVNRIVCPGYVFEDYLNPTCELPLSSSGQCSEKNPFRLVMRKQPAKRYIPYRANLLLSLSVGGKKGASEQDHLDVDLFRRVPSAAPYVDFTVTPHLGSDSREWCVEFAATNAGCGLLVTTNRVSTAPETGYQTRVKVPMDVFMSDTFALCLRTRTPSLYVLVAPPKRDRILTITDGLPRFSFALPELNLNLTGDRNLEPALELLDLEPVTVSDACQFVVAKKLLDPAAAARSVERLKLRAVPVVEHQRLARERERLLGEVKEMEEAARLRGTPIPEVKQWRERIAALEARMEKLVEDVKKFDEASQKEVSK